MTEGVKPLATCLHNHFLNPLCEKLNTKDKCLHIAGLTALVVLGILTLGIGPLVIYGVYKAFFQKSADSAKLASILDQVSSKEIKDRQPQHNTTLIKNKEDVAKLHESPNDPSQVKSNPLSPTLRQEKPIAHTGEAIKNALINTGRFICEAFPRSGRLILRNKDFLELLKAGSNKLKIKFSCSDVFSADNIEENSHLPSLEWQNTLNFSYEGDNVDKNTNQAFIENALNAYEQTLHSNQNKIEEILKTLNLEKKNPYFSMQVTISIESSREVINDSKNFDNSKSWFSERMLALEGIWDPKALERSVYTYNKEAAILYTS